MTRISAWAAGLVLALAASGRVAAGDAPFLWEVEGAKARHFLLGSVHMLPPTAYPLPEALEAAYSAAEVVVLETDLGALESPDVQGRMLGAARDDRPGGLKARIGDDLYRRLQQHARSLEMPTPVCDAFRAWFCALTLEVFAMQQAGFGAEFGIDRHFYEKAREDSRTLEWLEEPEEQLALFIAMSDELSARFLAATLDEVTQAGQSPADLHRIWRTGDLAELDRIVERMRARYPGIYTRMLSGRNHAWVPGLVERFGADRPSLVIIGAAHLAGPDGVPKLLREKGIALKRVGAPAAPRPAADD